jgi:hypothetical protein
MGVNGTRLLVLIFSILIPIYILIVFLAYDFQVTWFPWPEFAQIMVTWVAPILFTVSWLYVLFVLASRIADSIDILKQSSSVIRPHYLIFYGFNFLVVFFIFLVPVLIPFIAFLAFSSLVYRLLTLGRDWELKPKVGWGIKLACVIVSLPAFLSFVLVAPELFQLASYLFSTIWQPYIDIIYQVTLAIGSAAAIGEFVLLIRMASDEYSGRTVSDQTGAIRASTLFFEAIFTGIYLFFFYYNIPIWNWMLLSGGIFAALTFFVNWRRGQSSIGFKQNMGGYIIYAGLLLSNFLFTANPTLKWIVVILTVVIFGGSFTLIFFFHPDLDEES